MPVPGRYISVTTFAAIHTRNAMDTPDPIAWPTKHDIFGVQVSATRYDEVVEKVIAAAHNRQSALIDFMPVHGLIPAVQDPQHLARLNQFEIVAPDGQPVRWR